TDRNVLRLGLYEMLHVGTPAPVVLNEAIELAKEFGTEHSASFVNGILDKLIPDRAQKTKSDVGQSADSLSPN
ncbi:MAG: transcription antitermination factor NusB, partial [Phycisphaerae bacterium]